MKGTSYFRFRGRLCLFEILKIFYPPKGVCEAAPEGSIWRSFHFIMCSSKGTGHLRFWWGNPRFWNLQNVLSPEGSLRSSSEGVHLTVFPFYYVFQKGYWASSFLVRKSSFLKSSKCVIPRRDVCLQTPVGVQLFLLMFYFVLGNVYWTFFFKGGNPPFWNLKIFYTPKVIFASSSKRVHLTVFLFYYVFQ